MTRFASPNGRTPRGVGGGGFIDWQHSRKVDYLPFVFQANGRFTKAKQAAREHFIGTPECAGIICVCP